MSATTDHVAIREELSVLANRIEAVETRLDRNGSAPTPFLDLTSVMSSVRDITQDIFPGKCEFTSEFDPEYPEDRYLLVHVEATGSPKEIVDRSCKWDERIRRISPELVGNVRLFIVPR